MSKKRGITKKGEINLSLPPATHDRVTPLIKELHTIQRRKIASLNKNKIARKKAKEAKAKR